MEKDIIELVINGGPYALVATVIILLMLILLRTKDKLSKIMGACVLVVSIVYSMYAKQGFQEQKETITKQEDTIHEKDSTINMKEIQIGELNRNIIERNQAINTLRTANQEMIQRLQPQVSPQQLNQWQIATDLNLEMDDN